MAENCIFRSEWFFFWGLKRIIFDCILVEMKDLFGVELVELLTDIHDAHTIHSI